MAYLKTLSKHCLIFCGSFTVFLFSVLFAVCLIGRIANPQNTSWMTGDFVTMQFAWDGYRKDPTPVLALTATSVSWPLPIKITLFDIVPIIALPLKLLNSYLPANFQYLGPLFVLNAGLLGVFAFLFFWEASSSSAMSARTRYAGSIIAALIIAASPVFYHRFFIAHAPLTAQWLIIAALWLYALSDRVSVGRTLGAYAILLFIASGINPYLLVMTLGVYCGTVFKLVSGRRLSWFAVVGGTVPLAVSMGGLVLFGYLEPWGEGVVPAGGYGLYSTNINSLINPRPLGSPILPSLPFASVYQNEGYGYLGLGAIVIILAGLCLALKCRRFDAFAFPLLFVAVGAFLVALSTSPTLGPTVVFHVQPPGPLLKILEIFRSSGRFVWVTHYVLIALGAVMILRHAPARLALPFLAVGALVQIVDLSEPFQDLRAGFGQMKARRFSSPVFSDLGRAHDVLLVIPPWQCGPVAEPGYPVDSFQPVSFLAMDNQLKTNSFYSGRLPREQAYYHCYEFPQVYAQSAPNQRTAYLFTPRAFVGSGGKVLTSHFCDIGDNFVLCRSDRNVKGLAEHAAKALVATSDVVIAPGKSDIWASISTGFERQGDTLRMVGREAEIDLMSQMSPDVSLELEVTLGHERADALDLPIEIYVNSVRVGSLNGASTEVKGRFAVPQGLQSFGHVDVALVDRSARPGAVLLKTLSFKPLARSFEPETTEIEFRKEFGRNPFLVNGWSGSEPWGIWSDGAKASLYFPRPLIGAGSVEIDIDTNVFLAPTEGLNSQRLLVFANGSSLGEQRLDRSAARFSLVIPKNIIQQNTEGLFLLFELPDHNSPTNLGQGPDTRELAVGIKIVTLRRRL